MYGDRHMYKKAQTNSRKGRQTDRQTDRQASIVGRRSHTAGWQKYSIDSNAGWQACQLHCKEDPVYVFPEKKLHCLVLNFHIHVCVSDLYIPATGPPNLLSDLYSLTIGPPFCYSRSIVGYNSLTDTCMWKLGTRPRSFISGNICFEFLVQCLCSVGKCWVR